MLTLKEWDALFQYIFIQTQIPNKHVPNEVFKVRGDEGSRIAVVDPTTAVVVGCVIIVLYNNVCKCVDILKIEWVVEKDFFIEDK